MPAMVNVIIRAEQVQHVRRAISRFDESGATSGNLEQEICIPVGMWLINVDNPNPSTVIVVIMKSWVDEFNRVNPNNVL